jgi:energy-coupling factor transporter transmembrane protein EcfT
MFESRQTRLVGQLEPSQQRRFVTSAAAVLLDKAFQLSGEVHMAMLARGFRGEIVLLDDLNVNSVHWLQAGLLLSASCLFVWFGR